MLSRVAESLYWIGRYLERAENVTRLLSVTTEAAVEIEGLNDALVFQSVAAFSFSAGMLHNAVGWDSVCIVLIPFIAVVFVAVLWLKLTPGRAPPGLGRSGAAATE